MLGQDVTEASLHGMWQGEGGNCTGRGLGDPRLFGLMDCKGQGEE